MGATDTFFLTSFFIFCVELTCFIGGVPHPAKVKPGVCPYTDAICHGGPIGNRCKQDDQCPGARKCCPGSCGQACLLPENVKPGVCPVQYTVCRAAFDVCEKDDECPGIKRCCEGNCGTVCRTPEKEKPKKCPKDIIKCPTKGPYECNNDSECKKKKKCCFLKCALRCVEPY
ncbi:WAP four-disulfide core domain protein 5-like [Crotalus adamanteus]|uniref:WAP four-disulfide core domain protein 5-like n=1 Tax=Crotalus adamanteus TaxID=8729 RepID=A0AAW1BRK4_CROAD